MGGVCHFSDVTEGEKGRKAEEGGPLGLECPN